jgi:ankyrin repeat protein
MLERTLAMRIFDLTSMANWLRVFDPDQPYRESSYPNWTFPPPLYYSSLLGFVYVMEWLLDRGADVNAKGEHYYGNALQAASYEGQKAVVRLLLDRGADVNAQGGDYGNSLCATSVHGHDTVVRLLQDSMNTR